MRRSVVALALLGMAVCAFAESGDTHTSFPKKGTGRPTCILPVKNLRCTVHTKTGFVAGMRYGYGPIGDFNVCSQGLTGQTSWDMSPVAYRQSVPGIRDDPVSPPNWPGTNPPRPIDETQLMQYGSLITQVIVLKAENPLGPEFGNIPAIAFRYTNEDLAAAFTAGSIPEPYDWAICGNADYALAYLLPGSVPAPTAVELKATYTSPLSEDDTPSFLGSFQGKCAPRGSGYLGGDPNTRSLFHIKELKKVCFAKLAHVVPSNPRPSPSPRPVINYDWRVPYTPCYWDKKDSKKSTSFSCAASGATVATGKYAAIFVDENGNAVDMEMNAEGEFSQVPFKQLYEGDPETLAAMADDTEGEVESSDSQE